jgi:hypothetical protein
VAFPLCKLFGSCIELAGKAIIELEPDLGTALHRLLRLYFEAQIAVLPDPLTLLKLTSEESRPRSPSPGVFEVFFCSLLQGNGHAFQDKVALLTLAGGQINLALSDGPGKAAFPLASGIGHQAQPLTEETVAPFRDKRVSCQTTGGPTAKRLRISVEEEETV